MSSEQHTQSWKSIRQTIHPRAMAPEGRLRAMLQSIKLGAILASAVAIVLGGWLVSRALDRNPQAVAGLVDTVPVSGVAVETDGCIPADWVKARLALSEGAGLMQLDLAGLRERLLEHGQVRSVVLTRVFPSTLSVRIGERVPVARIVAEDAGGARKVLLVARDGTVYEGINSGRYALAALPHLAGVRLVPSGNGYAPLPGMEMVADLLAAARTQTPHLYRSWTVVSCANLAALGEIHVQTREIRRIIFSASSDFRLQLSRLDYIADFAQSRSIPPPQQVDLSLGSQVPVQFGRGVAVLGTPTKPTAVPRSRDH